VARDKAKDDLYFNCTQDHEAEYVAGLYPATAKKEVKDFLERACRTKLLNNATHQQVYDLIDKQLGYKQA
jgi:hypothetical protein